MTDASPPAPLQFPGTPVDAVTTVPCVVVVVRGSLDASTPGAVLGSIVATINEALGALEKVLAKHGAALASPRIKTEMHPMLPVVMVQAISVTTEKVRDAVSAEAIAISKALTARRRENGKIIALPPGVARA